MERVLYDGWEGLARTVVVGVLAYALLVVALRWSGKRTLSKMNAFDLVVTVALGSTLATVLLSEEVALAEGVLAFSLLIGLQFAVTWLSVRVRWVRRVVTGEPRMLLRQGAFLPVALRRARVTEDEVRAAVRSAGLCDLDAVEAVVLETDGSFSVVRRGAGAGASSMDDVWSRAASSTRSAEPGAAPGST
ncbi:MAG: DUF421 domain-containing protein [Gemmatimonadaceae bacterium]|nr:DUF421 domain-containing protein [Gemmatimonadaceae bacterium]